MTREPPSDSGGCHDNVTLSSLMSETLRGPTGAEGLSRGKIKDNWIFPNVFWCVKHVVSTL